MPGPKRAPAIFFVGLLLSAVAAGCSRPAGEAARADLPFLNLAPDVGYVGKEACRSCHFEEYSTYVQTGMGRAFYPMGPDVVVEDFTDHNVLEIPDTGMRYRMEERDGRYYQRQYMLDSKGREIAADEKELVYVLGSNNHSRSYVTETDGKLFQAPVCWYPDPRMWELCPGYEFKNDHFAREISAGCVHCHNGVMELVEGERNKYEEPYPHGIGCERCHGPGQLHVERWNSGETPKGEPDYTIVHVRRLPRQERIEVCFQCHLGDAKASERVIRHDVQVASFRPGNRITDIVIPFRYRQQTLHDFGLSAQADRLLQSKCYKESGGAIECLTCHNPHVPVYRDDRPADFFRQRCLSCHAVEDCGAPAAKREEKSDDCVACHMRKAEPDDQRFTEFTDHWIRRDIEVDERDHRERFEIEPLFPARLAGLPQGEDAFYQARALTLLSEDAPASRRKGIWLDAERLFKEAIAGGFDTVHSRFFLGKVQLLLGQGREAAESFEQAHDLDPAHMDAAFALGQAVMQQGDFARALEIFQAMLERDPQRTMALAEAGRAIGMLGRPEEALDYLERAILREPWNPTLRVNYAKLLGQLGRFDEAAQVTAEAVRLNPDDPAVWDLYEKAHLAAKRPAEASEARRMVQILSAAEAAKPDHGASTM